MKFFSCPRQRQIRKNLSCFATLVYNRRSWLNIMLHEVPTVFYRKKTTALFVVAVDKISSTLERKNQHVSVALHTDLGCGRWPGRERQRRGGVPRGIYRCPATQWTPALLPPARREDRFSKPIFLARIGDPHWFNADPDPYSDPDPVPNSGFWLPKIGKNYSWETFLYILDEI
jgi:hypothetical protein